MKLTFALLAFVATVIAAPIAAPEAEAEAAPEPQGKYASYGDYKDTSGKGYSSYGSYPPPAGGYKGYGTYKKD